MYSTDYHNLTMALDKDLSRVKFKKVKRSILNNEVNFISFDYAGRYTIEVRLEDYATSMWHYNGNEFNLMLTSSIDEELAVIGKKLINAYLDEILKAK